MLNDGVKKIKNESREILRRLTEIKIQIEKKETEDSMCGLRQIKLKEYLKVLKLDPAVYHGGDFEGKSHTDNVRELEVNEMYVRTQVP